MAQMQKNCVSGKFALEIEEVFHVMAALKMFG